MAISHLLTKLSNEMNSTVVALDLPEGTNYSDIARMASNGEITTEGGGKQFKEIEFDTMYSEYDMEISEHDAAVLDELLTEYEGGDTDLIIVRYVDNAEGTPPDILMLSVWENGNEKACQLYSLACSYQISYSSSYFEARPMWGAVTWADMDFELQVQYNYIPDPSDLYWGRIIQYNGADWEGYKTGYFYQCVEVPDSDPQEFTWEQIDVQPSGGGGSGYEQTSNKVTSLTSQSTDTQYPSAKAVWDLVLEAKNRATGTFGGLTYNDRNNAFVLDAHEPGIYMPDTDISNTITWYLRADSNHDINNALTETTYYPLMLILTKNYTKASNNDIIAIVPFVVPTSRLNQGQFAIGYISKANNSTGLTLTTKTYGFDFLITDSNSTQNIDGVKEFSSLPLVPTTAPTDNNQVISKAYFDEIISYLDRYSTSQMTGAGTYNGRNINRQTFEYNAAAIAEWQADITEDEYAVYMVRLPEDYSNLEFLVNAQISGEVYVSDLHTSMSIINTFDPTEPSLSCKLLQFIKGAPDYHQYFRILLGNDVKDHASKIRVTIEWVEAQIH